MTVANLGAPSALHDGAALESLFGPITGIDSQPLGELGFSGASHLRLHVRLASGRERRLVLKCVNLDQSWTAYRTHDREGREAALLAEPRLDGLWEIFRCPYLAYAVEGKEMGLLMDDLGESLLPDVDTPLSIREEDVLLKAMARMHAEYWNSPALDLPWLNTPAHFLTVLAPEAGREEALRPQSHPLFGVVAQGWELALSRLPDAVTTQLQRPANDLLTQITALPRTIVHGDAKVANFAIARDGTVSAFDWALIGAGPCTIDLGWYLAVNAGRLTSSREGVIARYRTHLESCLPHALPDALWDSLLRFGIVCAARMLLWEKALGVEGGSKRAVEEWEWWVARLSTGA